MKYYQEINKHTINSRYKGVYDLSRNLSELKVGEYGVIFDTYIFLDSKFNSNHGITLRENIKPNEVLIKKTAFRRDLALKTETEIKIISSKYKDKIERDDDFVHLISRPEYIPEIDGQYKRDFDFNIFKIGDTLKFVVLDLLNKINTEIQINLEKISLRDFSYLLDSYHSQYRENNSFKFIMNNSLNPRIYCALSNIFITKDLMETLNYILSNNNSIPLTYRVII